MEKQEKLEKDNEKYRQTGKDKKKKKQGELGKDREILKRARDQGNDRKI